MAKQTFSQSSSKPNAAGWDTLIASVDDLLRRRPEAVKIISEDHCLPVLRDRVDRGMCAVPIYRIVLGPHLEPPFERWLDMRVPLTPRSQPDEATQPIELYKVGDTYFVRSGIEQIALARSRSQLFLRADVVEYTSDMATRASDVLHQLIAQERADFFNQAMFPAAHPAYSFAATALGTFHTLASHLDQACPLFAQLGVSERHAQLVAWYDHVYLPIARLVRRRHLMAHFPASSELELFLWSVNRDGMWVGEDLLAARLDLARHNIASLWIALQSGKAVKR